jgi:hypothetical protein
MTRLRVDHIGSLQRPPELLDEVHRVYEAGHTALLAEERAKDLTRLHPARGRSRRPSGGAAGGAGPARRDRRRIPPDHVLQLGLRRRRRRGAEIRHVLPLGETPQYSLVGRRDQGPRDAAAGNSHELDPLVPVRRCSPPTDGVASASDAIGCPLPERLRCEPLEPSALVVSLAACRAAAQLQRQVGRALSLLG